MFFCLVYICHIVLPFFFESQVLHLFSALPSLQYNIKKKEEVVEMAPQEEPNPLMRKKKTPEELAREAEEAELDDFTSEFYFYVIDQSYPFFCPFYYPFFLYICI